MLRITTELHTGTTVREEYMDGQWVVTEMRPSTSEERKIAMLKNKLRAMRKGA